MRYPQSKVPNMPNIPPPPMREERKAATCDKNSEIEKIKRQLHNLIDRVDALKSK